MTILVLCNVGDRDVKILDREVAERLGIGLKRDGQAPWTISEARAGGRRLLDQYQDVAESLTFDILEPCLSYILARHKKPPDRLVLFGTDQPEGLVEEYHRQKDTLYFADLMARYYRAATPKRAAEVNVQRVQNINAALYDEAFDAYGELLSHQPREVEACYLIISGGVPACNAALLLQGVRRWQERARALYLPAGMRQPRELRAGEQILGSFQRAVVEAHLARLDFASALPLMDTSSARRALRGLVAYAQQRLDFDFDTAQATLLDEVMRHGDAEIRRFADTLSRDLDALQVDGPPRDRLRALLAELFWNSEIAFQQQRYADFLARVFRFQEAMLRYLVETICNWPTDTGPKEKQATVEAWNRRLTENPALRTHFTQKEVNGGQLTEREINRFTFKLLLDYTAGGGLDGTGQTLAPENKSSFLNAQLKRINAFDALVELRKRTVVGHDFEGVSLDKIRAAYPNGARNDADEPDPVGGMREILRALKVDVRNSPYQRVAVFVARQLQES